MNRKSQELTATLMVPVDLFETLRSLERKQDLLIELYEGGRSIASSEKYITAVEAMERLRISRATFDQLRANNDIKVIAKGRKLYVPESEIKRYFEGA